jgi:hypothetical protein
MFVLLRHDQSGNVILFPARSRSIPQGFTRFPGYPEFDRDGVPMNPRSKFDEDLRELKRAGVAITKKVRGKLKAARRSRRNQSTIGPRVVVY